MYTSAIHMIHAYVAIICKFHMHANISKFHIIRVGSLQEVWTTFMDKDWEGDESAGTA